MIRAIPDPDGILAGRPDIRQSGNVDAPPVVEFYRGRPTRPARTPPNLVEGGTDVHLQHRLLRRTAAAVLVATLVVTAAAPAYAAAPANDTLDGAVAIASLPFSTTLDTTEATTDRGDAAANPPECGAPATDATVWYDLTLADGDIVVADVSGSDYSAGVLVVTGDPDSFAFVTCGPGAVAFEAAPGVTYHMMIIDDQLDGTGNGGSLVLDVQTAPPPPELALTVAPTGAFNSADGSATIHGTVTCTGQVDFAFLQTEVIQKVGRGVVYGLGESELTCDGTTQQWSVNVLPFLGTKFAGGKAATVTLAFACGPIFCSDSFQEFQVQLKRHG